MRADVPLPGPAPREAPRGNPEGLAQLEALWEAAIALGIVDRDRAFLRVNGALAQITGLSAAAHVGLPVRDALRPIDDAVDKALGLALLEGQATAGLHVTLETPGGRQEFSLALSPVRHGGAITSAALILTEAVAAPSEALPTPPGTARLTAVRRRLEEERGKLTSLLESASDLIGVGGLDGRPLFMNEAGRKLVGLGSLEEGLQQPLWSFVHETERQRVVEQILPEVAAGGRFRGEVMLRHFDTGAPIPVEVVAFAIAGRDGKPTAIGAVGRDVRERRREEAERQRLVGELEGKQRLLDAVLQQMPAGVVVAEAPSGKLIFSNEQAEQILRRALIPVEAGASARMSIGAGPGDSPGDPEGWPLQRALRGETVSSQEIEVVRGDGTRAELRCNAAPLKDGQGQIFAAIVVFDDVSEKRRAARALLESEARFRRLAESGMIGVLVVEGDQVSEANEAFLALIGRTREELLRGPPLRWSEVAVKDHADRDQRGREEIRQRGFCKPFERDFLHKDGTRVPGVVGAALLEKDRKAWVLFVLDDRERRRAEELQRQLMGIVSHDLRSPLSAVVMSSSHLLYADDIPERHLKTAARIHTSAQKMRRLVNDLLDYQQARVGRGIPIHRRPADMHRICGEVVQELELLHPNHRLVYEPGVDGSGSFDADRVAQVLQNLLGNALAHGPDGAEVRLRWAADETTLQIEVHNGGPRIPASFLPQLFEPFRRGRPSVDGSSGFGLGLFIVQEIVRAHGGRVAVQSTEEDGTTFTVRLPRG